MPVYTVYAFAIETKGRSLEETAALFDGEDAVHEIEARAKGDVTEAGHNTPDEKASNGFEEHHTAAPVAYDRA